MSGYVCLGCGARDTSPRTDLRCSNGSPTGLGCRWVPVEPWPRRSDPAPPTENTNPGA